MSYNKVGVVGAGAWGTALAIVAAQAGRDVTLWARETEIVDSIRARGENDLFLPKAPLPKTITATSSLAEAARSDALLVVVPAQHLRETLASLSLLIARDVPLVICAKGIERASGKLVTEVLQECAPNAQPAILSGPSFARDVARNLPTAVTIAAQPDIARRLQETLGYAAFRPYASDDLTGVALGGAAKNVYAIASGIVSGLGLGESAVAAIIARSFAELMRLGEALGAKRETLMGLSGLGDLVLTATSPTSRNFSFGLALGKGRTLADLDKDAHPLAEGVETAPALVLRAKRHGIELPIAETVAAILEEKVAVHDAIPRLMLRPLKAE
ncbi:MAG: NAD(P)-dependent glycerol-3-phosphate dehydrogenase [Proteobacteria bacterium]|nr:NAD(P)-dependent glycerol-3-phosphate dehydrogenase [Pseudomonadota bacterium]